MMSRPLENTVIAGLGDVLWRQWAALGVAVDADPAQQLIDPDALLVQTAAFTEAHPDARLRDGALAWAIQYHRLISTTRVKRLLRQAPPESAAAFSDFGGAVAAHVPRLPWPHSASTDPWSPTIGAQLPEVQSNRALLRLHTRALFGAEARADGVACLATVPGYMEVATLERDTLFSRRQLSDGLTDLSLSGWVTRTQLGNATAFELSTDARTALGVPLVETRINTGPGGVLMNAPVVWIDWPVRYRLFGPLIAASRSIDRGDRAGAAAELRRAGATLERMSMSVPEPISSDEAPDDTLERLGRFVGHVVERLHGRGFLP